jgi:hypothetical protein
MKVYYGKCGCGWIKTDYPFMSCTKCGFIGCGSKEQLEHAKNNDYLIQWQTEKPKDVKIRDCMMSEGA